MILHYHCYHSKSNSLAQLVSPVFLGGGCGASTASRCWLFAVMLRENPPLLVMMLAYLYPPTVPQPTPVVVFRPLCFCWHGPACAAPSTPSLINLQSLNHRPSARHGPYIDEDRGTSHLQQFSRRAQVTDSRLASFESTSTYAPFPYHFMSIVI